MHKPNHSSTLIDMYRCLELHCVLRDDRKSENAKLYPTHTPEEPELS